MAPPTRRKQAALAREKKRRGSTDPDDRKKFGSSDGDSEYLPEDTGSDFDSVLGLSDSESDSDNDPMDAPEDEVSLEKDWMESTAALYPIFDSKPKNLKRSGSPIRQPVKKARPASTVRKPYTGDSRATYFRAKAKQKDLEEAAGKCHNITAFFAAKQRVVFPAAESSQVVDRADRADERVARSRAPSPSNDASLRSTSPGPSAPDDRAFHEPAGRGLYLTVPESAPILAQLLAINNSATSTEMDMAVDCESSVAPSSTPAPRAPLSPAPPVTRVTSSATERLPEHAVHPGSVPLAAPPDSTAVSAAGADPAAVAQARSAPAPDPPGPEPNPTPYVVLRGVLHMLIAGERKRQGLKHHDENMADLNVLNDFNTLREDMRRRGQPRPSHSAAMHIAACKEALRRNGENLTRGLYYARKIQEMAAHVLVHKCLPPRLRGTGGKHASLLDDEVIYKKIEVHLASLGTGKVTPHALRTYVNSEITPPLGRKGICKTTSVEWLPKFGYERREFKKGIYFDGHERPDVVEYRTKEFLPAVSTYEKFAFKYDDKTSEPIAPLLSDTERPHHFVFHDECCVHANDRKTSIWLRADEQQLRQKSRGRLVHVSDFIVEMTGRIRLNEQQMAENAALPPNERLTVTDARKIIHPGSSGDPYWDMKQLITQVKDMLPIYNRILPGTVGVFVFDHSSAHAALAPDALNANKMNVNPGGKNVPAMHSTRIPDDNPNPALRGQPQAMVTDEGLPKGMRQVLQERDLLQYIDRGSRGEPVGDCAKCKMSAEKRDQLEKAAKAALEQNPNAFGSIEQAMDELNQDSGADKSSGTQFCCMRRCLSMQHDFLHEKPLLQIVIEAAGHKCLFLPKFHCELNPIEMYWADMKRRFRERCDGTFPTARKLVPECLDEISTTTIRHYFRKCWRYMDAYRKGLDAKKAAYAVKKYKSHRSIPGSIMMDIGILNN